MADWNDGFNRVSITGRGESVWLAWFLIRVPQGLRCLLRFCRARIAALNFTGKLSGQLLDPRRKRCLGRAPGISARTSTMAGRWAARRMTSAGLI